MTRNIRRLGMKVLYRAWARHWRGANRGRYRGFGYKYRGINRLGGESRCWHRGIRRSEEVIVGV